MQDCVYDNNLTIWSSYTHTCISSIIKFFFLLDSNIASNCAVLYFVFLSTYILDSDGYEFTIVSLDNKQWQFEAPTQDVSS